MLICLDAGHSLVTAGKRIPANIAATVGNMHEWEFNSSVANKVATMLNAYENITTFRSDDITGKTDINVNTRASNINKKIQHLLSAYTLMQVVEQVVKHMFGMQLVKLLLLKLISFKRTW